MAIIRASRVNDTLVGTAGDDSITGSTGADSIDGGAREDVINGGGGIGGDAPRSVDTLHGGDGDDRITATLSGRAFGDAGDDVLIASLDDSNYTLEGGAGNDRLESAPFNGIVLAAYTTATSGVRVSLAVDGPQDVGGGQGVDTLVGMTGLFGSPFADTLTARDTGSYLIGGDGDDRLEGGPGPDSFGDGLGDDVILGGGGGNTLSFGAFGMEAGPTGGITLDLRLTTPQALGGGMGVDTILDISSVFATAFADTITGTDGTNSLLGEDGDDLLMGLGGDDHLEGRNGADTMLGGAGADTLSGTFSGPGLRDVLRGEDGDDRVFAQGVLADSGDIHGNKGNDTVGAGDAADTIRGGQGDDSLVGGGGNDFLAGDRGSDTLVGGAGADIFHAWSEAGLDRVTDFNAAEGDRVFLLPGAAPTISQVGGDTVIDFGGGNQMVLVGVTLATLPAGWIFGA